MASEMPVLTRRRRGLSIPDIFQLCDRLEARCDNAFDGDQRTACEDMGLAALALRAMTRSFHQSDLLRIEE
jgi:hypothetical protein